jgi:hypothetical protein
MQAELSAVTDAQVKAKGRIKRPTALLVDKSGSLEQAIEVGKRLAAMLAAIAEEALFVYAFDTAAFALNVEVNTVGDWERAFAPIRADGGTSLGAPLAVMRKHRQLVEQIVVVTDEEENSSPRFVDELMHYRRELACQPSVVFVKVGHASEQVEKLMKQAGLDYQTFAFNGDYYSLPNLIPFLTRPSRLELLMEILETPLPKRASHGGLAVSASRGQGEHAMR